MTISSSLLAGLLFGLGLILSGMTDPAKVLGFLDLAGGWNPSLALVMAGAIAVGVVAFAYAARRNTSWLGQPMRVPGAGRIDGKLLLGSALFGAGWGLAGLCPGPALVNLASGDVNVLVFVGAMLVGMGLFEVLARSKS